MAQKSLSQEFDPLSVATIGATLEMVFLVGCTRTVGSEGTRQHSARPVHPGTLPRPGRSSANGGETRVSESPEAGEP